MKTIFSFLINIVLFSVFVGLMMSFGVIGLILFAITFLAVLAGAHS